MTFNKDNHISNAPDVLIPYIQGMMVFPNTGDKQCDELQLAIRNPFEGIEEENLMYKEAEVAILFDGGIDSELYWMRLSEYRVIIRAFQGLDVDSMVSLTLSYIPNNINAPFCLGYKELGEGYRVILKFKL